MLLEATIIQFLAVVALFEQGIETAVMHTFLFHHANSRLKVAFIASLIAQLLLELSTNHVAALKIRILGQNFVEVAQGELVLLGVDEKHRALVECHKVALVLGKHCVKALDSLLHPQSPRAPSLRRFLSAPLSACGCRCP